MRRNLLALTAFAFSLSNVWASVSINNTNFPDEHLLNLTLGFDANMNGVLDNDELAKITEIKAEGILNLKGIENFKNLESICLYYGSTEEPSIESINLSKLSYLHSFSLQDCGGITSLDLGKNTSLRIIELLNCPNISTLKLPSYLNTIRLEGVDSLTSLNLNNYSRLKDIDIHSCTIESLTMNKLPSVQSLTVQNNNILSTTIEECKGLTDITCKDNVLATLCLKNNALLQAINVENNQLQVLIADKCPKLGRVKANNNQLMWLDMKDVKKAENIEGPTLQLDNQQRSVEAVRISPTEVGLLIHNRFDISRMKNFRINGIPMTPKEIKVDGVRYLILSDNGTDTPGLLSSEWSYEYDTKWPYAGTNDNSEDNSLPVTLNVDKWTKHQAYLKVSKSEVKGKLGEQDPESVTIIRSKDYDGEITFSSSNENIVEVDSETGELTVVGAGTATIYVEGEETEYRLAPSTSYTVNIAKGKPILMFPKNYIECTYGDSEQKNKLNVVWYDGTITYASSDKRKATVSDEGVVTILGAGKVTIYGIAPETDNFNSSKVGYELKIEKASPKFRYEKIKTSMEIGQPIPENKLDIGLYDGVPKFKSSNEEILYIDEYKQFYILKGGIVRITASGDSTENCYEPKPASYVLEIEDPNGITPIEHGTWTIEHPVYDLSGRKVLDGSGKNNNVQTFPLNELKKGIYIINGRKVRIR